jgi:DNA-binding NarL/FixJ family response regulator
MAHEHRQLGVAIVDDDLWIRNGRAHALAGVDRINVVATLSHSDALGCEDVWASVDVALVDAWDHRAGFDRFPGVGVVESIRRLRTPLETVIIVITGHVVNDVLRLRMAEAGADYFYGHDDVASLAELVSVITAPDPATRPVVDPHTLDEIGVRSGSKPNDALAWIQNAGLSDAFSGESQKALPVTRRTIMRIRREMGNVAKIEGSPATGAEHHARWPEWQHVVRFVNRVRGSDEPPR